ncbi:sigma-70 family RNA polymerase sigma factor [Variovorax boronicumulans]|uniref:sigma-70 family RNA polymerase sigma factor n=1 Tax=Variovorax boronicumulans TaxID=436515 RepID=UPI0027D7B643|nr:sigma-70 family RNA polymerase sigma factor [Variovorax boronicumulans]
MAATKANDVATEAPDLMVALWVRWRRDQDEVAREQLIRHYLPYARMVAATVYGRRTHNDVEFDDYLQLARVGLLEAVDRFELGQGAQFKTFAAMRVQGAVLNGLTRLTEKNQQISVHVRLRQERLEAIKDAAAGESTEEGHRGSTTASTSSRGADKLFKYLAGVGIGLALGVLLEDTGMVDAEAFDGNGHVPSPEVSYFRKAEIVQLRTVLRDLLAQLSDQQRTVIRHHYLQEIPFGEIAMRMGVTRGRVSQLHRQGLLRLRELLSKDARCDVSW